jgi:ParB-like chromosome segregation protein Spo0J
MKKIAIAELVFDLEIYPRGENGVDATHVAEIAEAMAAGTTLPPIIVERKTNRIIDGVHRFHAYKRLFEPTHKVECVEKTYADEREIWLDVIRFNTSHGKALNQHDKVRCLLIGKRLGIDPELLRGALHITAERVDELLADRVGTLSGRPFALKRTVRHMAGRQLTDGQAAANEKLSGMNQVFYANQLILLLENDLVNDTEQMTAALEKLGALLANWNRKRAA